MTGKNRMIAVFDSGMGGLTVLREIARTLPNENMIYYADALGCPYGEKSREEVLRLTFSAVEHVLSFGVKLVVIACNTATSVAASALRKEYPEVMFVAMEPAVKPAICISKAGVIGVLATRRTIEGDALRQLCEKYGPQTQIVLQAAPGLVDVVEASEEDTEKSRMLVERYVTPFKERGVDVIVLGCTHYPFLRSQIESVYGDKNVKIIDAAEAVANRVNDLLVKSELKQENTFQGEITFSSSLDERYNDKLREKYLQIQ